MSDIASLIGLATIPGKATRLYIAAGAALALVAATLYAVHYFTAKGYDQAALECKAANQAAQANARELELIAAEERRETAMWQALGRDRLRVAVTNSKKEVQRDNEAKPEQRSIGLNADGLRLWNADPITDAELRVQPGDAGADRSLPQQPASSAERRSADTQAEPRGQQGSLQSPSPGRAGLGFRVPKLLEVPRYIRHEGGYTGREGGEADRAQQARSTSPTN